MKTFKKLAIGTAATLPLFGFAQSLNNLFGLVGSAQNLINVLIGFVIALATLTFIWGLLGYVTSSDPEKQKSSKGYMVWGIIGLFVMVSVWGLVAFLQSALFGSNGTPTGPTNLPRVNPYTQGQ